MPYAKCKFHYMYTMYYMYYSQCHHCRVFRTAPGSTIHRHHVRIHSPQDHRLSRRHLASCHPLTSRKNPTKKLMIILRRCSHRLHSRQMYQSNSVTFGKRFLLRCFVPEIAELLRLADRHSVVENSLFFNSSVQWL